MKRILFSILATCMLLAASAGLAQDKRINRHNILVAATATGAGATVDGIGAAKTYQVVGATTAGSGSAVVAIQCSNDGSNWDTLGTITLTLSTTSSSNSFASSDRCYRIRANVTTLSGTGASVSVYAGY